MFFWGQKIKTTKDLVIQVPKFILTQVPYDTRQISDSLKLHIPHYKTFILQCICEV